MKDKIRQEDKIRGKHASLILGGRSPSLTSGLPSPSRTCLVQIATHAAIFGVPARTKFNGLVVSLLPSKLRRRIYEAGACEPSGPARLSNDEVLDCSLSCTRSNPSIVSYHLMLFLFDLSLNIISRKLGWRSHDTFDILPPPSVTLPLLCLGEIFPRLIRFLHALPDFPGAI